MSAEVELEVSSQGAASLCEELLVRYQALQARLHHSYGAEEATEEHL